MSQKLKFVKLWVFGLEKEDAMIRERWRVGVGEIAVREG